MTLKAAQKMARELGMSIRKTAYGDYRINTIRGPESHATYEDRLGDAVDTMLYIVKRGLK